MVWAKTDEVGCAAHRCAKLNLVEEFVPNGWFITCLYNPKFVQILFCSFINVETFRPNLTKTIYLLEFKAYITIPFPPV